MRKKKPHDEKPKLFSKKNAVSLFIVFIMIFSIMGFIISQNRNTNQDFEYNGFIFKASGNTWITEVNGKEARFINNPFLVKNVKIIVIVVG